MEENITPQCYGCKNIIVGFNYFEHKDKKFIKVCGECHSKLLSTKNITGYKDPCSE